MEDRENLFRGKRTDTREWVEGCYYKILENYDCGTNIPEKHYIISAEKIDVDNSTDAKQVDYEITPESVGQYIGEIDKNKNKIFVGHFVQFYTYDSDDDTYWLFKYFVKSLTTWVYLGGGVDFGNGIGMKVCICEVMKQMHDADELMRGFEIIGNIIDNPELLEGEGK